MHNKMTRQTLGVAIQGVPKVNMFCTHMYFEVLFSRGVKFGVTDLQRPSRTAGCYFLQTPQHTPRCVSVWSFQYFPFFSENHTILLKFIHSLF